jgi:hypothetical protein
MDPLDKIRQTIRDLVAADGATGSGSGGSSRPSARQAAQAAIRESFVPRHALLKQIRIVEVGPDRRIPTDSEEYFRVGHRLREVHTESRVLIGGGSIVRPETIRLQCRECGEFDTEAFWCACGMGICRRCVRRLVMPDGQIHNFCPAHYHIALDRYNTWEAIDRRGTP